MPRNMLHPLKKDLGLVKKWGSQRRKTQKKAPWGRRLKRVWISNLLPFLYG